MGIESTGTRTERTELEPAFWIESNWTRTQKQTLHLKLKPNRTHVDEEPVAWVLKKFL